MIGRRRKKPAASAPEPWADFDAEQTCHEPAHEPQEQPAPPAPVLPAGKGRVLGSAGFTPAGMCRARNARPGSKRHGRPRRTRAGR